MTIDQANQEKPISSALESVLDQLSTDQIRFIVARQQFPTDKEAAEVLKIKPDTVYHWPPIVKEALSLMAHDGLTTALHLRRKHLAEAMLVKVEGLKSKDDRLRQGVATEIIEWETGKATQWQEVRGQLDMIQMTPEQWRVERAKRHQEADAMQDDFEDADA